MTDWNEKIIGEFRANGGKVGGNFEGAPLLLLHSRGAKSGAERVHPMMYQRIDDDSVAVFASYAGMPRHPDWYYNLLANPDASVEMGDDTFPVRARVANDEEREPIWTAQKADYPGFAEYEEKTQGIRDIPVVILERVRQ